MAETFLPCQIGQTVQAWERKAGRSYLGWRCDADEKGPTMRAFS
jgi:hypothetical protein